MANCRQYCKLTCCHFLCIYLVLFPKLPTKAYKRSSLQITKSKASGWYLNKGLEFAFPVVPVMNRSIIHIRLIWPIISHGLWNTCNTNSQRTKSVLCIHKYHIHLTSTFVNILMDLIAFHALTANYIMNHEANNIHLMLLYFSIHVSDRGSKWPIT